MLKKVKEILDKRSKINDEDDYRIEKCRDELIDALSQDELLTIDILNQLNEKEILYTSEISFFRYKRCYWSGNGIYLIRVIL